MLQSLADSIIQNLESGYDKIAEHFSNTRHDAWPEFVSLKSVVSQENAAHTKLLDVGCGNGRLAAAIPVVHYTGFDLSSQLLTIARQHYPQHTFIQGSLLHLPFPDQQFDVITCIATLQHIPSLSYRRQAVQEMYRVLKAGGTLFMLNWNLAEQPTYQSYRASLEDGYDADDFLIPWKNDQGAIQVQRYYHGFRLNELAELMSHAHFTVLTNTIGPDQRNLMTIAKRP